MNFKRTVFVAVLFFVLMMPFFSYAEADFDVLIQNGIVLGDEGGLRLNDTLKRCEFVAMINRTFEMKSGGEFGHFSDVYNTDWYYDDFKIAVSNGYLKGNGDMFFSPSDEISRAEAATLIGRIIGYVDYDTTDFSDDYKIQEWAKGPVSALKDAGIISGYPDGSFMPDKLITREEAFVIFKNIINVRFDGGDGSADNPYVISKPHQLFNIKYNVNAHYILKNDLSFLNTVFIFNSIGTPEAPFGGSLDGMGHKITGLYTTESSKNALFDTVGADGKVSAVKIVCPDVFFSVCVTNNGVLEGCANTSFTGSVQHQFKKEKGGIASVNNGTVSDCYNSSDILSRTEGDFSGGIVGENNGTIRRCFNTGSIRSAFASGIAGTNRGKIEDCFNSGIISVKNARPITDSYGKGVENCVYTGENVTNIGKFVTKSILAKFYSDKEFIYSEEAQIPVPKGVLYSGNENFNDFSGGDGSSVNPFIITDAEEFAAAFGYPQSYFIQTKDINLSRTGNMPEAIFEGVYDGGGNTLSGFQSVFGENDGSFLFSENYGIIKNLNIADCYGEGKRVSVITLKNYGTITDCNVSAVLTGENVSGIALENHGEINGCSFSGKITSGSSGGGITLVNYGNVKDCLSRSDIFGTAAAGIAFENNGRIGTCCFFGDLSAASSAGIVYQNFSDINSCYYTPGHVSVYDNKGRISAVTRDDNQRIFQGSFPELDFENKWVMEGNNGPVPTLFSGLLLRSENTADFAGGNGSAENPFRIVTPKHLDNVRLYPDASYVLLNNIDMAEACAPGGILYNNGKGFLPIKDFEGAFFGNGYKISGLYQNNTSGGFIEKNYGIISSLSISAEITADYAAVIANKNYGTILFCTSDGRVNGREASGIAIENTGGISECVNNAQIHATITGAGISAHNRAEIVNCLNIGEITGIDESSVIFGICSGGEAEYCLNAADIYFLSSVGEFYPVSDTNYINSFYIDRYNRKFNGALNYSQLLNKESFNGFDFINVWAFTSKGLPTLKNTGKPEVEIKGVFGGGNGSLQDPYLISTPEELYNIRMYKDSHFKLTSDINLSGVLKNHGLINNGGKGFEPIDDFYGSIDGNNCVIYGLTYVDEMLENVGLFGVLHGSAYDIIFSDCRIEGLSNAGVVTGVNYGKIRNITVRNSRIGTYDGASGGIAGTNRNEIEGSINSADVFSQRYAGGVAGINYGFISKSSNRGGVITVTQTYDAASGGIAGNNNGNISECYNIGSILSYSESDSSSAGGIAGYSEKSVINCYNTGGYNAKGKLCYAGGIVGYSNSTGKTEHTYNIGYGNISGEGELGSLIGGGYGEVSFSYYEHTLPDAVGGDVITYDVYPVSQQMLFSNSGTEFLHNDAWFKTGDFYPQIIGNEHSENMKTHNVRDFAGGDGSIENPYIIMTPEQLDNVRRYLGSAFVLMGDIDMSFYSTKNVFEPIGNNVFGFFGTFLGNGYKIKGLNVAGSALFKQNHGEIYNLVIDNMSISSSDKYCGIAEINTGLIYQSDTYSDLSLNLTDKNVFAGAIAGLNLRCGMIISSFSYGNINVAALTSQIGGVCYGNYGVIAGCAGEVNIAAEVDNLGIAGGICAYNYGTVSDSCSGSDTVVTGEINASRIAGGITGVNGGNIVNCYSSSDNINANLYGGICANPSNGVVVNCYYNEAVRCESISGAHPCAYSALMNRETFKDFDFYTMWYMPEDGTPKHIR